MKVSIECICPGRKHDKGDTIVLRDKLDFRTAIALRNEVAVLYAEEPEADLADVMAVLTDGYLTRGIESWTLRDKDNKPLPPSRANIREHLLSRIEVAQDVGEVADELYQAAVMLPLLQRASRSLPATPTTDSTSVTTDPSGSRTQPAESSSSRSPMTPRKRSKQSSTPASLTVVTEATSSSLGGDSSLSPRTESAA